MVANNAFVLKEDRDKAKREGKEEGRAEGKLEGKKEGIELTKKVFKLSYSGKAIKEISKECGISEEEVETILR